jgi:hypothetical protein|tara:strand:- start:323 stop:571 length:249 start_codon:yes stop_codon:yes gene_type:complete
VIQGQDIDSGRLFLRSILEKWSWLVLLTENGLAALEIILDGPGNANGGSPFPFRKVLFQVVGNCGHEQYLMCAGLALSAYFS